MITLLRKIRRSATESGATRKYILYVIGEIALVVIGILIALQINNWNQYQKDRETEKIALLNLVENMELNIDQINYRINRINSSNESGKIILAAIHRKQEYSDTLGEHFHEALLNHSNLTLSIAGYESLKNIGFAIISNEVIKKKIVNLYEFTYLNLERNQVWGATVRPDFNDYLTDHFIRYEAAGWMPRNFNEIAKDHYFLGLINIAEGQRRFYEEKYRETLEETIRVLQLIRNGWGETH